MQLCLFVHNFHPVNNQIQRIQTVKDSDHHNVNILFITKLNIGILTEKHTVQTKMRFSVSPYLHIMKILPSVWIHFE